MADGRFFVKFFLTHGRAALQQLTDEEVAALARMALHIRMRDNVVRHPAGAPMRQSDIARLLRKSVSRTRVILAELERKGALRTVSSGTSKWYVVSEDLFARE